MNIRDKSLHHNEQFHLRGYGKSLKLRCPREGFYLTARNTKTSAEETVGRIRPCGTSERGKKSSIVAFRLEHKKHRPPDRTVGLKSSTTQPALPRHHFLSTVISIPKQLRRCLHFASPLLFHDTGLFFQPRFPRSQSLHQPFLRGHSQYNP
jgi:hypothetical protein